jgi:hypothetical protein
MINADEAMLEMCDKLPDRRCPFCDEVYDDIAEYVDVGVGYGGVQITPNCCEECGAQQQGAYDYDSQFFEFAGGWVRPKYKMPIDISYCFLHFLCFTI